MGKARIKKYVIVISIVASVIVFSVFSFLFHVHPDTDHKEVKSDVRHSHIHLTDDHHNDGDHEHNSDRPENDEEQPFPFHAGDSIDDALLPITLFAGSPLFYVNTGGIESAFSNASGSQYFPNKGYYLKHPIHNAVGEFHRNHSSLSHPLC